MCTMPSRTSLKEREIETETKRDCVMSDRGKGGLLPDGLKTLNRATYERHSMCMFGVLRRRVSVEFVFIILLVCCVTLL